ncbi:F-box protein At1g55000 [Linum perenne]
MNSNFSALTCRDTLRLILEKLAVADLARSCCVCRVWNSVASDDEITRRAFMSPWKLKEVVGKPAVMDIKRLNNMMSDHGIYSRDRLLIPITDPVLLINSTCYVELDSYAKREVAVLYLTGQPDGKLSPLSNNVASERGRRRVLDSLRRSMQVDDETALYYLTISNGDPRAAISEFSADLRWETQVGST